MKYVKCKYALWETTIYKTIITGYIIDEKFYSLDLNGNLTIYAGYAWDGATGAIDTDDFIVASLVHDIFCELINAGILPPEEQARADEQMRIIQKRYEMHSWRRFYTYMMVRTYQLAKRRKQPKKIYEI